MVFRVPDPVPRRTAPGFSFPAGLSVETNERGSGRQLSGRLFGWRTPQALECELGKLAERRRPRGRGRLLPTPSVYGTQELIPAADANIQSFDPVYLCAARGLSSLSLLISFLLPQKCFGQTPQVNEKGTLWDTPHPLRFART